MALRYVENYLIMSTPSKLSHLSGSPAVISEILLSSLGCVIIRVISTNYVDHYDHYYYQAKNYTTFSTLLLLAPFPAPVPPLVCLDRKLEDKWS